MLQRFRSSRLAVLTVGEGNEFMTSRWMMMAVGAALGIVVVAGCGSPPAEFREYVTFAYKVEESIGDNFRFTRPQQENLDTVMASLFGTPDQPALPKLEGADINQVVDITNLRMAAGPVGSDKDGRPRGLYREHCAHCHGITGDGVGPTAVFLNPYPRDYRPGKYKFKSTPVGSKPTHEDLVKIVYDGIPGTAMPSFKLLPEQDLLALVDYVKYLSIRGETERNLLMLLADTEEGQPIVDIHSKDQAVTQEQLAAVKDTVAQVVEKWATAGEAVVAIPPRASANEEELTQSVNRGRNLFYGTIANCIKCHGDSALGDGQTTDYDDWTKEFMTGTDVASLDPYIALGLMPPRTIKPRNLRIGNYRGGNRPIDLFWRVRLGIEGTPMPAATLKQADAPNSKGLTEDDIWDIVNYVQSLPREVINNPHDAVPANLRERL
jgi:mono/diheme cytochrome c family protein